MSPSHLIYLLFIIELFLAGFWFTTTAITQAFLLIAVVIGFRAALVRGAVLVYTLSGLMLVYLAWLAIVSMNSQVPYASTMMLATLANLPVMYLAAANTPTFAEIWKYLRMVFFVVAVGFAIWALWQVIDQVGTAEAVGPFNDRNLFAALMNVFWFPAAFLFLDSRPAQNLWRPILTACGLFMISAALFATTSRGGIGTWILLLPFLLWAAYRNTSSRRLVIFIPLIAILAYFFSAQVLQADLADRTFQVSQDPASTARLLLWKSSMKMALAHPFMGTGWGTFANYYPAYRFPLENSSAGLFAHNDYLQMAAEGGFMGMLLQLALFLAVLLQLRRSLKRAADSAGLESVALLLGTLALFIHASVNFIFFVAFMNVLAGLYLARAAQLTEVPRTIAFLNPDNVSIVFRRMFAGSFILLMMASLLPNLVGEFLNRQSNVKAASLISNHLNAYQVAEFITSLKPEALIAQEIVLRSAEQALADSAFLDKAGIAFQRKLLNETLERFDSLRALTANNPKLGVRQARILIKHHTLLDAGIANGDAAYVRAYQVLNTNLKVDPYHTDSIILLARLYALEGRHAHALHILKLAEHRVFGYINQSLITVEILRLLALPGVIPELDEIEKQLYLVNADAEIYRLSVLEGDFIKHTDARLSLIASQISPRR